MAVTVFERARERQQTLAVRIADKIFDEYKGWVRIGDLRPVANLIHTDAEPVTPDTHDLQTLELLVKDEIKRDVIETVIAYTDWLADRMAEHTFISGLSLRRSNEVPYAAIGEKFGVKPALVKKVVSYMNGERRIPLIGRLRQGILTADEPEFLDYKKMLDEEK